LGLGTVDHFVPFQWRITDLKWMSVPTAQALVLDAAAAPNKKGTFVLGLGTWDQVLPFQCRSSAWNTFAPVPQPEIHRVPTAQASVPEVAVTADRAGNPEGSGFGLGTWVQAVPFQCRISVRNVEQLLDGQ